MKKIILMGLLLMPTRYFYHGDGKLVIQGGDKKLAHLSGRLVALLDYLQDSLSGGKGSIKIISGYRSPAHNENLRKQGKLAGKASLHLEGMAADFSLAGVPSKKIWEMVRNLNCCGVGYYHGREVHLDTGPPRFWDETSSKVFTDIADNNKRIYLTTEYDIYQPGETMRLRFVRITQYPFGVLLDDSRDCRVVHNREEAADFSLDLSKKKWATDKKIQIKARFCSKPSQEMPDTLLSNPFIIASPR